MNPAARRSAVSLGLLALGLLAGCADSPPWGGIGKRPTTEQIKTALGRQDEYVYFPSYEIYFNRTTSDYVYWDGNAWITGIEPPRGVPPDVLLGSPAVAMNFHDAPAAHHTAIVRRYPHNWGSPPAVMASSR